MGLTSRKKTGLTLKEVFDREAAAEAPPPLEVKGYVCGDCGDELPGPAVGNCPLCGCNDLRPVY